VRNKLGSVAIADVYTQQVQLGNAELQLIQAQNELERAKSTLLNFLALDVFEEYTFVDPFVDVESIDTDAYVNQFDNVEIMVQQALENRKDYKGQQLVLSGAESGITIAQGGIFPRLTGNYGYSTSAVKPDALFDRKNLNIGLTLSLPIFSNFNTDNQIQIAEVQAKNAKEDLDALERQIKIEIKQGYLDLIAGKKSLDVAIKNVKSAEENRKINNERYRLGSGTILDVLQSNRDYQDALRNRIDAEYNFYRLLDNLKNALGKLDYQKFE
jgi:outer membrane protein